MLLTLKKWLMTCVLFETQFPGSYDIPPQLPRLWTILILSSDKTLPWTSLDVAARTVPSSLTSRCYAMTSSLEFDEIDSISPALGLPPTSDYR
jgi:hypothetical protein